MIMATHDINLAARFCDHILLMLDQGRYVAGPRASVLTESNLSEAYDCDIRSIRDSDMMLYFPA